MAFIHDVIPNRFKNRGNKEFGDFTYLHYYITLFNTTTCLNRSNS